MIVLSRSPKNVEALLGKRVKDIALGLKHVLALTDDNQIYGWGSNELGQVKA